MQVLQGLREGRPVQSSAIHIPQEKRPQLLCQSSDGPSSHLLLIQPSPFICPGQTSVAGQKRSQNLAQTAERLHTAAYGVPTHAQGAARGQPGGPGPEPPGPPQRPAGRASSSDPHLWPQTSGSRPEKALVFGAGEDERDWSLRSRDCCPLPAWRR